MADGFTETEEKINAILVRPRANAAEVIAHCEEIIGLFEAEKKESAAAVSRREREVRLLHDAIDRSNTSISDYIKEREGLYEQIKAFKPVGSRVVIERCTECGEEYPQFAVLSNMVCPECRADRNHMKAVSDLVAWLKDPGRKPAIESTFSGGLFPVARLIEELLGKEQKT